MITGDTTTFYFQKRLIVLALQKTETQLFLCQHLCPSVPILLKIQRHFGRGRAPYAPLLPTPLMSTFCTSGKAYLQNVHNVNRNVLSNTVYIKQYFRAYVDTNCF